MSVPKITRYFKYRILKFKTWKTVQTFQKKNHN